MRRPYKPPPSSNVVKVQTIYHPAEPNHPASRKAVIMVHAHAIQTGTGYLDKPLARRKFRILAGSRFDPTTDSVKISCDRFPTLSMNQKWCSDALDRLVKESEVRIVQHRYEDRVAQAHTAGLDRWSARFPGGERDASRATAFATQTSRVGAYAERMAAGHRNNADHVVRFGGCESRRGSCGEAFGKAEEGTTKGQGYEAVVIVEHSLGQCARAIPVHTDLSSFSCSRASSIWNS